MTKKTLNDKCFQLSCVPILTHVLLAPEFIKSFGAKARIFLLALQWHHNGHDGILNHLLLKCLLNRLFRRRSKKTSKLHVTGLCAGNSPVTGEFPAQRASNAKNISNWWRHPRVTKYHQPWYWLFQVDAWLPWGSILTIWAVSVSRSDRKCRYNRKKSPFTGNYEEKNLQITDGYWTEQWWILDID